MTINTDPLFNRLSRLVRKPSTHSVLVRDFPGEYSLGIGKDDLGNWALNLHLSGSGPKRTESVEFDGFPVTVLIRYEFTAPIAQ